MHTLVNADCLDYLQSGHQEWTTIFADPPDNIGLKYNTYRDSLSPEQYVELLRRWLTCFILKAPTVWFSFNAKWTCEVAAIVADIRGLRGGAVEFKPCARHSALVSTTTMTWATTTARSGDCVGTTRPLLPDAIRIPSWRQENGDKRADPRGRVPGDVLDFPRVTGNSKQRRSWHKTQLHEGLVERCVKLTTPEGGTVLDPFAGTGTTLRVCKRTNNPCTLIEMDRDYCKEIAKEHGMVESAYIHRSVWRSHALED